MSLFFSFRATLDMEQEDTSRRRQSEEGNENTLVPKKKFHDAQDLERKGELLERFQEMPSTHDRPVDPFLVMAMIAVPK
jgi:hypothetical protein